MEGSQDPALIFVPNLTQKPFRVVPDVLLIFIEIAVAEFEFEPGRFTKEPLGLLLIFSNFQPLAVHAAHGRQWVYKIGPSVKIAPTLATASRTLRLFR